MFGSEAVKKAVYNTVRVVPAVQAVVSDRIYPKQSAAPNTLYPYLLHYPEDAPFNQDAVQTHILPTAQTIRHVLRFIDQRENDITIRPAWRDSFAALVRDYDDSQLITTDDGEQFQVSFQSGGEWTGATDYYDPNGRPFTERGFYLICYAFRQ